MKDIFTITYFLAYFNCKLTSNVRLLLFAAQNGPKRSSPICLIRFACSVHYLLCQSVTRLSGVEAKRQHQHHWHHIRHHCHHHRLHHDCYHTLIEALPFPQLLANSPSLGLLSRLCVAWRSAADVCLHRPDPCVPGKNFQSLRRI